MLKVDWTNSRASVSRHESFMAAAWNYFLARLYTSWFKGSAQLVACGEMSTTESPKETLALNA